MIIVTLRNFTVLVAVQRVIGTAFPLKRKLYVGKKNTKRICLIIYAFSLAAFATLTILNFTNSINFELTTAFLMCIVDTGGVFIILCYTLIAFILKKSSQQKTLQTSNIERSKRLRKTNVVTFIVSLSFCISYDPVATLLITNGPEWAPAFEVVLYFDNYHNRFLFYDQKGSSSLAKATSWARQNERETCIISTNNAEQ